MVIAALAAIPANLPTSIPALSTNALIVAGIGLVVAYSLIAGHAALVREAISIYVGLVLAGAFGEPLYHYLQSSAGGSPITNHSMINLILLIVPIILLQFGRRHGAYHHKHNLVVTLILAVATGALLISSILAQLDALTLARITDSSPLASWLYDFKLVWLAAVPVAIGASAMIKPRSHH